MNKLGVLLSLLLLICFSTSCNRNRNKRDKKAAQTEIPDSENKINQNKVYKPVKIAKATFFIENSESMFGYVNGFTQYVDVLSELAEKPQFAEENTPRKFYFINGGDELQINAIGDDPVVLKDKLNISGYRCGDPTKSNLNSMFQTAMDSARKDSISILISDAIYDIGRPEAPMNALATKGKETRSKFIQRLGGGDLQTIMIKLQSRFDGYYFPVSGGKIKIKQTRPFYIWIFGESELLNKYFTEEYINSLEGFENMARFLKFDGFKIPYQAISQNKLGSFRFGRSQKNKLTNVKGDRNGQGFQFSFATDFSLLPFSDSYFQDEQNYSCTNDYNVSSITKVDKTIHAVTTFKPTHLITVTNLRSPYGELDVFLKNVTPDWIVGSHTDDESDIKSNTTQTFGFKFLTDAISEAYAYKNKEKLVTQFKFDITQ